jgi:hypothetical protein
MHAEIGSSAYQRPLVDSFEEWVRRGCPVPSARLLGKIGTSARYADANHRHREAISAYA